VVIGSYATVAIRKSHHLRNPAENNSTENRQLLIGDFPTTHIYMTDSWKTCKRKHAMQIDAAGNKR